MLRRMVVSVELNFDRYDSGEVVFVRSQKVTRWLVKQRSRRRTELQNSAVGWSIGVLCAAGLERSIGSSSFVGSVSETCALTD